MSLPQDFQKQTFVTYGFIVWVAMISFLIGRAYAKIEDGEKERGKIYEYVAQEVGGLRADWERDKKEQDRRLINLEDE